MNGKDVYKVATRYQYIGDVEKYKPGDIFKKNSTIGYEGVEGIEFTLEDVGNLYIAVDKLFYDISNQWEDGMNIEEFLGDLRKIIYQKQEVGE